MSRYKALRKSIWKRCEPVRLVFYWRFMSELAHTTTSILWPEGPLFEKRITRHTRFHRTLSNKESEMQPPSFPRTKPTAKALLQPVPPTRNAHKSTSYPITSPPSQHRSRNVPHSSTPSSTTSKPSCTPSAVHRPVARTSSSSHREPFPFHTCRRFVAPSSFSGR